MKNIKNVIIGVLICLAAYFIYDKITAPDTEIQYVDVVVEVPVPGVAGEIVHDTIWAEPEIVTVESPLYNNLLEEYAKTKDSLERLKLFTDAITIRTYNEIFEDSIQKIDVRSKVQGKLLGQDLSYFVKPTTIVLDTTLAVPIKKRFKVFAGGEIGFPTDFNSVDFKVAPTFKANLILKNRKDNMISIGVDTRGTLWGGYLFKL